jgi:hypothetical protein
MKRSDWHVLSPLEFGHWGLGVDWDLAPWSLVILTSPPVIPPTTPLPYNAPYALHQNARHWQRLCLRQRLRRARR